MYIRYSTDIQHIVSQIVEKISQWLVNCFAYLLAKTVKLQVAKWLQNILLLVKFSYGHRNVQRRDVTVKSFSIVVS